MFHSGFDSKEVTSRLGGNSTSTRTVGTNFSVGTRMVYFSTDPPADSFGCTVTCPYAAPIDSKSMIIVAASVFVRITHSPWPIFYWSYLNGARRIYFGVRGILSLNSPQALTGRLSNSILAR